MSKEAKVVAFPISEEGIEMVHRVARKLNTTPGEVVLASLIILDELFEHQLIKLQPDGQYMFKVAEQEPQDDGQFNCKSFIFSFPRSNNN